MTPYKIATAAAARLLRWELRWLAFEVLGVAIGLALMLGTELDEAGGGLLFLVCGMSFFVRGRQYAGSKRQT
jgi:hypothetical protein